MSRRVQVQVGASLRSTTPESKTDVETRCCFKGGTGGGEGGRRKEEEDEDEEESILHLSIGVLDPH